MYSGKEYIARALALFGFKLLTWVLAPVLALVAAVVQKAALPGPLSLFHTHDAPVWGEGKKPKGFGEWYKDTLKWILRNPAYGFAAKVLGVPVDTVVKEWEKDGWEYKSLLSHPTFWLYARDIYYTKTRYVKVQIGWWMKPRAGYYMLKIGFNPFKRKER